VLHKFVLHTYVHITKSIFTVYRVDYLPNLGIIPKSWNRYTVPVGLTVIQWVMDFAERIKQLQKISEKVQESGIAVLKVSTH